MDSLAGVEGDLSQHLLWSSPWPAGQAGAGTPERSTLSRRRACRGQDPPGTGSGVGPGSWVVGWKQKEHELAGRAQAEEVAGQTLGGPGGNDVFWRWS